MRQQLQKLERDFAAKEADMHQNMLELRAVRRW